MLPVTIPTRMILQVALDCTQPILEADLSALTWPAAAAYTATRALKAWRDVRVQQERYGGS